MNVLVMVTVSGSNRHELVRILSEKTHALGGKWIISKINHIDDYFSGLIKIEIGSDQVQRLGADFKVLGLNVEVVVLDSAIVKTLTHLDLNIDARDRPGLVHDISEVLAEHNISVENMECHRLGVADISGTVFTSNFKIAVNDKFSKEELINALQNISEDLVVEINGPL